MAFQMTSDDFFAKYDPKVLLGGTIDFAFLDGLHWFEFLLRDFINVEKHARRNSLVLMHDCIPTDTYIARREVHDRGLAAYSPHLGWWAGDVWKTAAILLKYRPDLCIYGCKASPTGLLVITNLDPTSTALRDNYSKLVDEYSSKPSSKDNLEDYVASLNFLEPRSLPLSGLAGLPVLPLRRSTGPESIGIRGVSRRRTGKITAKPV